MFRNKVTALIAVAISLIIISYIGIHLHASSFPSSDSFPEDQIPVSSNKNINSEDKTYNPPSIEYDIEKEYEDITNMYDVNSIEIDLEPNSITVLVNKEYALPSDYKPDDLIMPNVEFSEKGFSERNLLRKEAAEALEQLIASASKNDLNIVAVSGYRSYERQYQIFTNNLVTKGKTHTLKYSAIPGTSEHQTGLTMDVSCGSVNFLLHEIFERTPEGIWLSKNAHKFGYIIRYPKDKVDITGYAYEPWHIRYVGKALATFLFNNSLTLDEYYNYTPSANFNFEEKYADILSYTRPVRPTPTELPKENLDEDDELEKDNSKNKDDDELDNDSDNDDDIQDEDDTEDVTEPPLEDTDNEVDVPITEVPHEDDSSPSDTDVPDDSLSNMNSGDINISAIPNEDN